VLKQWQLKLWRVRVMRRQDHTGVIIRWNNNNNNNNIMINIQRVTI